MAKASPREFVQAIIGAFELSGYSAILLGGMQTHPRKFLVTNSDGDSQVVWVYVWTLTPGGRVSLPNEYRIQMTTVKSPLEMNPNGRTVLLGYEPNSEMFAGFDLNRHQTFTAGSPSVQIDINAVRNALQFGLTFDRKTNDEIGVGIRPDQFYNYVMNSDVLHRYGKQTDTFGLLQRAAKLETIPPAEIEVLPEPRKKVVQTVIRLFRKANFRQQVMHAYGNRCAVTRLQLRLVDAAHIVPVGAPLSVDDVTNGLSLSPTYHRAYDNGLIYLDEKYEMKLNPAKIDELRVIKLDGGIKEFRASLGQILLPPDRRQWPKLEFIRKANSVRDIL